MSDAPQGRACIYVPREIAPPGVDMPRSAYLTHGKVFEQWRSFVQLPNSYSIACVYIDQAYQQWVIVIGSNRLPIPIAGQKIPVLAATFQNAPNDKVHIINTVRHLSGSNGQKMKQDITC